MKKVGSETPIVTMKRQRWSMKLSGRVAASMPSGTAMPIETSSAERVSSSEAGSRVMISWLTLWPVEIAWPRLP